MNILKHWGKQVNPDPDFYKYQVEEIKVPQDKKLEFLQDGLDQHRMRLAHLQRNQEKFAEIPGRSTPEFGDYLVLLGAVMREENTCRWIEECMRLCKEE